MNEFEVTRDVLANFGARLRAHRYRLNISLTEVALVIGVSDRNLAAIERGVHQPRLTTMLKLLDWMARSVDDPPRPGESRQQAHDRAVKGRAAREAS